MARTKRDTPALWIRGVGRVAGDRTLEKSFDEKAQEIVERNHKAGQNPPRVVAPTEEEEEWVLRTEASVCLQSYLTHFLEWEMFQTKVVELTIYVK
jgi:hypothetical protein